MSADAKACPWCGRWCLKDNACAYIFACGLDEKNQFHVGLGCGKSWCWTCGKKYCTVYFDPVSGVRRVDAKENHDANCCSKEDGFKEADYCPGGHSAHCDRRW